MTTEEAFSHYLTGIDDIDDRHWDIIKIINDAVIYGRNHDMKFPDNIVHMQEELDNVKSNLKTHFAIEDLKMERANYPYIKYHKEDHTIILSLIRKIIENLAASPSYYSTYTVLDFLSKFVGHIDQFDIQYSEYIKNKK